MSQVFSIEERGRALFEAAQRLDLEGIVAKRTADPYAAGATWYKIKNRAYTQMEGRGELFMARADRRRTPGPADSRRTLRIRR